MEIKNRPNYIYSWNICPTIKCNLLDLHLPSRISECFQDNTFHQSNHFHLKIFINSGLNFLLLLYNYIINFLRMNEKKFQFSSVAQSCPTLCNPMNRSTPGLPVHHQLPESTQTHVHRVSDAIQPSHPLSSPSPPAFNLSQHQDLFK